MGEAPQDDVTLLPPDPEDQLRWDETALRVRILDGKHRDDVLAYFKAVLNATTLNNLGRPSLGINLYQSYVDQVCRLYDDEPDVTQDHAASKEAMETILGEAELWQIAQKHAQYVVGARESAYRIGWSDRGNVTIRPVTTDRLLAYAPPDDPNNVLQIRHGRLRGFMEGGRRVMRACWDVWTADPDNLLPSDWAVPTKDGGSMLVLLPDGTDVTRQALGPEEAEKLEAYPWRDVAAGEGRGRPFLPWQIYHAAARGCLWSPYELQGLVDGGFTVTVLWNKWLKLCRDAAFRQRVLIDGDVPGTKGDGKGARKIALEPDSILRVESRSAELKASLSQWDEPADPKAYAEAIGLHVDAFLQSAGLNSDDMQRAPNAQSGYAIQLKRSAQRREARKYEPQFRRGDEALLAKVAMVHNVFAEAGSGMIATEGWGVTYRPPGDSIGEQMEAVELEDALEASGLMSRAERLQRREPSLTPEQAFSRAIEIAIQKAALTDGGLAKLLAASQEPTTEDALRIGREVLEARAIEEKPAEGDDESKGASPPPTQE